MTAVSLFRATNMAGVTSCENRGCTKVIYLKCGFESIFFAKDQRSQ